MTEISFTEMAAQVLTHDILQYLLGAGGVFVVVNIALANQLAVRKIRSTSPGWTQIRREFVTGLRTVLIFATVGTFITWGATAGILPIYADIEQYGAMWLAMSMTTVIVAHDAWFYWMHRLIHHHRLYRRVHQLHHRSYNPTPFSSYAFDVAEAAGHAMFLPLFLAVVPMHPFAILIFAVHMMLRNAIGHSGYEIFPARGNGRPLIGWLTTVTHHDLHHAQPGHNFGLYFTWWDQLMGTEHPDYHAQFRNAVSGRPTAHHPGAMAATPHTTGRTTSRITGR